MPYSLQWPQRGDVHAPGVLQVVLLDPMYDAYGPMCRRAGGIPKLVPLDPETGKVRSVKDILEGSSCAATITCKLVAVGLQSFTIWLCCTSDNACFQSGPVATGGT